MLVGCKFPTLICNIRYELCFTNSVLNMLRLRFLDNDFDYQLNITLVDDYMQCLLSLKYYPNR